MTTEAKHMQENLEQVGDFIYVLDSDGQNKWDAKIQSVRLDGLERAKIANRIVTAVNSHDALVEALNYSRDKMKLIEKHGPEMGGEWCLSHAQDASSKIVEALKLAGAK